VFGMHWDELDLDAATWSLSATKAGRPHLVPLPKAAVEMLRAIPPAGERVFDFGVEGTKYVGRDAWGRVCREAGLVDAHIHDLRRTVATHLGRLNVDQRLISMLLNHAEGGVTKVYQRYEAIDERREALERWSAELARIVAPRGGDNVVELFPTGAAS
jgi:integrase